MWPLVIGGLAIAALVAVASSKKEQPKQGQLWHLVFGIHPAIGSEEEFKAFENSLRYIVLQSGQGELVSVEYPAPNTVDVTIRYIKGAHPMPVNEQAAVGPYTMIVTLSERVG